MSIRNRSEEYQKHRQKSVACQQALEKPIDSNTPEWIKICQFIRNNIQDVKSQLVKLDQAQKQHLIFSIGKKQKEREELVDKLTAQCKVYLDNCKKKFKQLQALIESNEKDVKIKQSECAMQKNARNSISQELYQVITQYRENQKTYFTNLKDYKKRIRESNPFKEAMEEQDNEEKEETQTQEGKLSDSQIQEIITMESVIKERDKELKELMQNITELNSLFVEFNELVMYQQEIIDRIDENINNTVVQVETGNANLRIAQQYQAKPWNILSWFWK